MPLKVSLRSRQANHAVTFLYVPVIIEYGCKADFAYPMTQEQIERFSTLYDTYSDLVRSYN